MRIILRFLSVFVFFSTVITDDTSLFSDLGSYPSDLGSPDYQSLWTDDSSLGTDDPLPGESMFDETSPQMLSFDGCSSGDLGMAGGDLGIMRKMRRGQTCRSDTSTNTQGALEPPTSPDPEKPPPDDRKNTSPDPLSSFPYMPPPTFDGVGCASVGEQIFIYTVCGSRQNGIDRIPSTLLDFRVATFSVTNADLSKYQILITTSYPLYHRVHEALSLFLFLFPPSPCFLLIGTRNKKTT